MKYHVELGWGHEDVMGYATKCILEVRDSENERDKDKRNVYEILGMFYARKNKRTFEPDRRPAHLHNGSIEGTITGELFKGAGVKLVHPSTGKASLSAIVTTAYPKLTSPQAQQSRAVQARSSAPYARS